MDNGALETTGIITSIAVPILAGFVAIGKLFGRVKAIEETQASECVKIEALETKTSGNETTTAVLVERIDSVLHDNKTFREESARNREEDRQNLALIISMLRE